MTRAVSLATLSQRPRRVRYPADGRHYSNIPPLPDLSGAACAGTPLELWFPNPGEHQKINQAKAICHRCPVEIPCGQYAIEQHELGVWGGLTEEQRDVLRGMLATRRRRPVNHGRAS